MNASVVVELTLNDRVAHTFDAPERRAYEQLLRKALRVPGAAAEAAAAALCTAAAAEMHG
jgi:hypothetical protein